MSESLNKYGVEPTTPFSAKLRSVPSSSEPANITVGRFGGLTSEQAVEQVMGEKRTSSFYAMQKQKLEAMKQLDQLAEDSLRIAARRTVLLESVESNYEKRITAIDGSIAELDARIAELRSQRGVLDLEKSTTVDSIARETQAELRTNETMRKMFQSQIDIINSEG